jgi:hypothetical protein
MPQNRYGMGVAVGDFDNDGFEDLYVTGYGGNTLYRNNGNGTFTDITARAGVAGSGWSTSAGFFDYDNDGKLDLFVARYLEWNFDEDRFCGERKPGGRAIAILTTIAASPTFCTVTTATAPSPMCRRRRESPTRRGNRWGWHLPISTTTAGPIFTSPTTRYSASSIATTTTVPFTDVSLTAGAGFNEDGKTFAGMGVDFADYDNDGRPDITVTDLRPAVPAVPQQAATAPSPMPPMPRGWVAQP